MRIGAPGTGIPVTLTPDGQYPLSGTYPHLAPGGVTDLEAGGLGHQRQHVRQA